ncbi:MAG: hypothetical protein IT405_01805 [Candidatus Yanofskybacteria bacterium]|nr:hypothetical protein [Candidatus Yanofskybacteria bacterium]
MTTHSFRSHIVRGLLFSVAILAPLAGPGASWILVVLVATVLAYDGPTDSVVYGTLALLCGVELVYGIPLGVLSLAYAIAVVCVVLVSRFVSLTPWVSQDGWRVGDVVRTFVCALGVFSIMAVGGVGVSVLIYGSGAFILRLRTLPLPPPAWLIGVCVAVLVLLRRADEPFRRRVIFGV